MLRDRHLTQLVFPMTVIKTWALGFAHLLIFRARKENSSVLSKQGHVRIAELERKPTQALLCSHETSATGCGRGLRAALNIAAAEPAWLVSPGSVLRNFH